MKHLYTAVPVLVTGGCGFIGSYVAEKLVEYGAFVTIIDNLSTGTLKNIKNIKHKVTFIQESITNYSACLAATQGKKIIFHLAALTTVQDSLKKPLHCHHINVDGTINLLEAARINNVKRFVFSSSAAVYGTTQEPCTENTPCNPESPYGFSKQLGELYCKQYTNNFGLTTIILRYFNVFGARQNPHHEYAGVIATFTQHMQQNKPITIFGDGMQTRDFIPVERVAEANLHLAFYNPGKPQSEIFNIATGKSISLIALIDQLRIQFPNYTHAIQFKKARSGDILHSQAICQKYQKALG